MKAITHLTDAKARKRLGRALENDLAPDETVWVRRGDLAAVVAGADAQAALAPALAEALTDALADAEALRATIRSLEARIVARERAHTLRESALRASLARARRNVPIARKWLAGAAAILGTSS